ncbi:annexin D5-like [Impatiens glandulifera]|uniref:annexin D5-like n=1 Tax=Impatiens glandulifera TaxID=253017 RepID=UPI001FB0D309|nr:annexin D5-like [Impatiens glandulifera]
MASMTIPAVLSSPRDDAIQLHRAFKGFGCDTAIVINILAHRDSMQRSYIRHEFRTMYGEELDKRLAKELSGDLERAVLLWMHDPATRDAIILRKALFGDAINVKTATEVICSRTPSQLLQIKQLYHSMTHSYLEHDIEFQCTGDHKKLLLAYLGIQRYEGPEVDRNMVEHDANALYKAGEKKFGTDEKTFIRIFSERSRAHMAAVDIAYTNLHKHSLQKAVKNETSGHFEHGLLTILRCAENPGTYFAKLLHKAMKGMGTQDTWLIRTIVTRAEIDMEYIKGEYQRKYKKTLKDAVKSETSGNYKDFLLALLGY